MKFRVPKFFPVAVTIKPLTIEHARNNELRHMLPIPEMAYKGSGITLTRRENISLVIEGKTKVVIYDESKKGGVIYDR